MILEGEGESSRQAMQSTEMRDSANQETGCA